MERVVTDKDAQGVLRSALWSQRGDDGKLKRIVTWGTARGIESIVFTGGIIMLSNRPLTDMPELRAIRTRISHLHLAVPPTRKSRPDATDRLQGLSSTASSR